LRDAHFDAERGQRWRHCGERRQSCACDERGRTVCGVQFGGDEPGDGRAERKTDLFARYVYWGGFVLRTVDAMDFDGHRRSASGHGKYFTVGQRNGAVCGVCGDYAEPLRESNRGANEIGDAISE